MKNMGFKILNRSESAVFLIELLVALVISSLLALVLCSSIGQFMRLTTTTEQNELAAIVAQEVLERLKNLPYDADCLSVSPNQIPLIVNDSDALNPSPPQGLERPLLLDTSNLQYTTLVDSSANFHRFQAKVFFQVSDGPVNPYSGTPVLGTKTVTVHVLWTEPNRSGPKDLEVSTVLFKYGMQHDGD